MLCFLCHIWFSICFLEWMSCFLFLQCNNGLAKNMFSLASLCVIQSLVKTVFSILCFSHIKLFVIITFHYNDLIFFEIDFFMLYFMYL